MNRAQAVYDAIVDGVLDGTYEVGGRVPTERDMSVATGVSRITVRSAYARLEATGVLTRRQGSGQGTRIAETPRGFRGAMEQVALLTAIDDPYAMAFVSALEGALTRRDALLVLKLTGDSPSRERRHAADLVRRGLRNLVVWPAGGGRAVELFARIRALGCNVVFIDRMLPGATIDFVGLDNRHAVETLFAHACERGLERFVFVSHAGLGADSDRLREEAFAGLCRREGRPHRIVRVPWRGDVSGVLREHAADWFPPEENVGRAIFCVNDATALQVRSVLSTGNVVYGIDGLPEAVAAGIVTYRQPYATMAREACRLLLEQSHEHWTPPARRVELRGHLVQRSA